MITPMAARLVRDPFAREDWLFEIKWDGFRAIAETDGAGNVSLYSSNRNDFKKRFPLIAEALMELKRPAVLDGEIVALDDKGKPRFEWLVNRGPQCGTLVYYVFDLLMLDGSDLRQLPLLKRKARHARLVQKQPVLPPTTVGSPAVTHFRSIVRLNLRPSDLPSVRSTFPPSIVCVS